MNNKYVYNKEIQKDNLNFKIYFRGIPFKENINYNKVKELCDKYFNNLNFYRELDKIIGDIRTLFRDFNELQLFVSYNNKNNNYDVRYVDKKLLRYENHDYYNNIDNYFSFDHINGINFNINQSNIFINSSYNNKYINIYENRIKELCSLKDIDINKITNEILYINELYKLFYGKYPNYNSKNINLKIQNMIYILSEYGIHTSSNYNFSNNNNKRIPICEKITDLVSSIKPYATIDSSNIVIERKYKNIITIIKNAIKNIKPKDIAFDEAATYLSMVLYASKHQLRLGYTLDNVTDVLNCSNALAEKGLRLYKNVNKSLYEKN